MNTADSERDEWMIDESLKETFPASDPTSPARPGSLLGMRYPATSRSPAGLTRSTRSILGTWLIAAVLGGTIVGILLAHQRKGL